MLDGCCFCLEDSTVVFHFEGMLCDGLCAGVGNNKPATCTSRLVCTTLGGSVRLVGGSAIPEVGLYR